MEGREITDQDHEVLGAEYCSGYTDIFGKWNTGFYCPSMGNGETVYCCGTITYKYCCTRRDQHSSSVGLSQAVILGSAIGSVLVLFLVTVVSCLVCRRCVPYRRGHPSLGGGPLYSMHCSSTASGVANMYSFSGQNTAATTPLDHQNSDPRHVLVDMDTVASHQCHQRRNEDQNSEPHQHFVPHRAFGILPSDPPPPYNEDGGGFESSEDRHMVNHSAITNSTTSFTTPSPTCQPLSFASSSNHAHSHGSRAIVGSPENVYWSTKF